MKYYYVTQTDKNSGTETLIGFNLTKEEKNELFYSFNGSSQDIRSGINNGYGCHDEKFKNKKQAIKELITKPKEFNDALAIMKKYGFVVFPKTFETVSYQQYLNNLF